MKRSKVCTEIDTLIGENIKKQRVAQNISRSQLSREIHVTHQQLAKYEKAMDRVSASKLFLIARFLKSDVSSFYAGL